MFAAPIDQLALDLYTRIITKAEDQAVYALENGICGGGHMKVVSGTIQTARTGETLAQGKRCGSILYLVE